MEIEAENSNLKAVVPLVDLPIMRFFEAEGATDSLYFRGGTDSNGEVNAVDIVNNCVVKLPQALLVREIVELKNLPQAKKTRISANYRVSAVSEDLSTSLKNEWKLK